MALHKPAQDHRERRHPHHEGKPVYYPENVVEVLEPSDAPCDALLKLTRGAPSLASGTRQDRRGSSCAPVRKRSDEQATIEAEIVEMNETRKQAAEQLKELKALKSATKKLSSKSAGKSRAVATSSSSSGRVRPRVIASNPLRIPAEQAAPKFDPTQGQDLRTIFGNTLGSQANVAATVTFAPPTEHFPAPPAAQLAASSDTSRSDSVPIDFNALGDLLDTDFFAFLDTINSMPVPAIPRTETDDTFGFSVMVCLRLDPQRVVRYAN
ncbi:hypothetical protein B0H14DRAFT_3598567 [Mycena olivaceomarginata]|nr:hypothetical protein B0H14DRAFT_3598567 [Mycena olivaceomarginata]